MKFLDGLLGVGLHEALAGSSHGSGDFRDAPTVQAFELDDCIGVGYSCWPMRDDHARDPHVSERLDNGGLRRLIEMARCLIEEQDCRAAV
jgi:hypothetical protein